MSKLTAQQVQEIVEGMASRLSDYIAECEELPSKWECAECGRNNSENFPCGCHNPKVREHKECPQCGEWIDLGVEPVWACCMAIKVVDESKIKDCYKQQFSELLHKLFKKAEATRPINRDIDEQMIDVICDAYEDSLSLKEATDFING